MNDYQETIKKFVTDATEEIDAYCKENDWVSDVKKYTTKYSAKLVLEWKSIGSIEIEEQLNKIRNWTENIKTNIEKTIITKNKLFKVDCRPVENILVPQLDSIYNEICEIIFKEINKDTLSFIEFISKIIKVNFLPLKNLKEFLLIFLLFKGHII